MGKDHSLRYRFKSICSFRQSEDDVTSVDMCDMLRKLGWGNQLPEVILFLIKVFVIRHISPDFFFFSKSQDKNTIPNNSSWI